MSAIIDQIVATIRNARYGRDVRESIAHGIELIDDVAEGAEASATASATEAASAARSAEQYASNAETDAERVAYIAEHLTDNLDLDDLANIGITNPTNGQVLKYNSTSQKWENAMDSDGGNSIKVVDTIPEATYTNLGTYLYVGDSDPMFPQIPPYSFFEIYRNGITPDCFHRRIYPLAQPEILSTMPPASNRYGKVLYVGPTDSTYKCGGVYEWLYSTSTQTFSWRLVVDLSGGGASDLDDLGDVNISNPSNGQVLKYDSTSQEWINANESGGGGTTDYTDLTNKPQINSVTLSGNKTASDLSLASLDANGKVPSSQLPSYVDDVLEYASLSNFPVTGETGKIYVALDTNRTYRWGGSEYVEISESLALGETASTAYAGNKGKANADNIATIQGLIPSSATTSNKLATAGDIPTVPSAYTSDPEMDGTASAGSSTSWARGNHVHPHDTTKVDVVAGKGLSTNDYTTAEKTKLAGLVGVVANPSGTATADLTKLKVDNTTYDIQGGHIIRNESGTALAQRKSMQFNNCTITDDSTNNKTIVQPDAPLIVEKTYAQYLADKTNLDASGNVIKISDQGIVNNAVGVSYDNTNSGLVVGNVQGAIDEISGNLSASSVEQIVFNWTSWTGNGGSASVVANTINKLGGIRILSLCINVTNPSSDLYNIGALPLDVRPSHDVRQYINYEGKNEGVTIILQTNGGVLASVDTQDAGKSGLLDLNITYVA